MQAVITGDIINSRNLSPRQGVDDLKSVLEDYGSDPEHWEIFRGDSFQLLVGHPQESLGIAMRIKAGMKTQKDRDVRMAIGIGSVSYKAGAVTESNGEAFVRSGETFESLRKQNVNLAIQSPWSDFDEEMNLYFQLALIAMDDWSEASAEFIKMQLANEERSQQEMARLLDIGQSSVSARKNRAHYDELIQLIERFRNKVERYL